MFGHPTNLKWKCWASETFRTEVFGTVKIRPYFCWTPDKNQNRIDWTLKNFETKNGGNMKDSKGCFWTPENFKTIFWTPESFEPKKSECQKNQDRICWPPNNFERNILNT